MSEAFFQRSVHLGRKSRIARMRPWPKGYGLLVAAVMSLGLWAAIILGLVRAFA